MEEIFDSGLKRSSDLCAHCPLTLPDMMLDPYMIF